MESECRIGAQCYFRDHKLSDKLSCIVPHSSQDLLLALYSIHTSAVSHVVFLLRCRFREILEFPHRQFLFDRDQDQKARKRPEIIYDLKRKISCFADFTKQKWCTTMSLSRMNSPNLSSSFSDELHSEQTSIDTELYTKTIFKSDFNFDLFSYFWRQQHVEGRQAMTQ